MKQTIDTIIFDLDGVITDTASLHQEAWAKVFDSFWNKLGMKDRHFTHSDYIRYVDGKSREDGALDYLTAYNIKLPITNKNSGCSITIDDICKAKNKLFENLLQSSPPKVFSDAEWMLKYWHKKGFKIALVSSSQHSHLVIKSVGLIDYFRFILGGKEKLKFSLKSKTQLFEKALELLSSPPSKAMIIEDALSGIHAASKIPDTYVIAINRHDIDPMLYFENGARIVIDDLRRLEQKNQSSKSL